MTTSDQDFWRQFDELERRRATQHKRREVALRLLSPATASSEDADARSAWEQYCESVHRLEASIEELERLIWRMR
jgi:hypothetical protein